MQSTTLQLVEVNQTTLIQWHNKWVKRQDVTLLLQGISLPGTLPVASEDLPPANIHPAVLPQTHCTEHVYNLPPSTAALVKMKRQAEAPVTAAPQAIRPKLLAQKQLQRQRHSQYQGTIYCPNTETIPKELSLEQIRKSKM